MEWPVVNWFFSTFKTRDRTHDITCYTTNWPNVVLTFLFRIRNLTRNTFEIFLFFEKKIHPCKYIYNQGYRNIRSTLYYNYQSWSSAMLSHWWFKFQTFAARSSIKFKIFLVRRIDVVNYVSKIYKNNTLLI